MMPYPLVWLRYSTFIILYPLGVASEMTMVWLALPHIRRSHMWSIDLPNALNFAFDYFLFCLLAVVIYIPGRTKLELQLVCLDAASSMHPCLSFVCRFSSVVSAHAQPKKEGTWPAKVEDTLMRQLFNC